METFQCKKPETYKPADAYIQICVHRKSGIDKQIIFLNRETDKWIFYFQRLAMKE